MLGALAGALVLSGCGAGGEPPPVQRGSVLSPLFTLDSLAKPESVAFDSVRSRYLVTNIAGASDAEDGNGFISAVSSDGARVDRRALSSATPGLRLDGPKGIVVRGDRAYVADIHRIVGIDLAEGRGLFAVRVPDSRFLNDVAVAPDGSVYVSDTFGDAIYRVDADGGGLSRLGAAGSLRQPNGLVFDSSGSRLLVAGWEGAVVALAPDSSVTLVAESRRFQHLDGLARLPGGGLLVGDFSGGSIYRLSSGPRALMKISDVWMENRQSPADFLLNGSVLAVPEMGADRVLFFRVESS